MTNGGSRYTLYMRCRLQDEQARAKYFIESTRLQRCLREVCFPVRADSGGGFGRHTRQYAWGEHSQPKAPPNKGQWCLSQVTLAKHVASQHLTRGRFSERLCNPSKYNVLLSRLCNILPAVRISCREAFKICSYCAPMLRVTSCE